MERIKPCPFCGHDDPTFTEVEPGRWAVDCDECMCIGPYGGTPTAAGRAWNQALRPAKVGAGETAPDAEFDDRIAAAMEAGENPFCP